MSIILNIETATKNCSVSLAENGNIISLLEINEDKYSHSEKLHILIKDLLSKSKIKLKELDAIAISKGPGSYTGLRIGVSAAKGLCFALKKPLISVSTLTSLATSIKIDSGYIIPMLDARRMEVYSAVFDRNHEMIRKISAEIICSESFSTYLNKNNVYLLGDGASKCKNIIDNKNAVFIDDKFPSSKEMGILSYKKLRDKDFEDVAYFEPFYLKNFIAIKSKKQPLV